MNSLIPLDPPKTDFVVELFEIPEGVDPKPIS